MVKGQCSCLKIVRLEDRISSLHCNVPRNFYIEIKQLSDKFLRVD